MSSDEGTGWRGTMAKGVDMKLNVNDVIMDAWELFCDKVDAYTISDYDARGSFVNDCINTAHEFHKQALGFRKQELELEKKADEQLKPSLNTFGMGEIK